MQCDPPRRRATAREFRLLSAGLRRWRPGVLPGGLTARSPGITPRRFDQHQLAIGTAVEMEHTGRPDIAVEIAMDHLIEDPCYYAKLEAMEGRHR